MLDFTSWHRWSDRESLQANLGFLGVYALAITTDDVSGQPFDWRADIDYIGMTNSRGGLRARLRQFDRTIAGGEGHGGGCRVRYVHRDYNELVSVLFVAVCAFACRPGTRTPQDLRTMGEVAKAEYDAFAIYVERFGNLPLFNRPESKKLAATDLAGPG